MFAANSSAVGIGLLVIEPIRFVEPSLGLKSKYSSVKPFPTSAFSAKGKTTFSSLLRVSLLLFASSVKVRMASKVYSPAKGDQSGKVAVYSVSGAIDAWSVTVSV